MKIAVHAFDGITMFHLAAPLLVFGEVSWDVSVWTSSGRGIRAAEGVAISDVAGPSVVDGADLLVLPSWHTDLRPADDALVGLIRDAHRRGTRIAGLCLGAFPVVDSGLLDGRTAVTHWSAAADLARRRPGIEVNPSALYLDHGDVLTSAGTASAIDACLHVLRTHLGSAAASTVARHLVVAPHRDGGQAQYVDRPMPEPGGVGQLGDTLDWALAHLDRPLTVDDLADRAGMSRRNFTRRFAEVTGSTPARWVLGRRLDESRRLLEATSWSVERIGRACGFGSAVTFRQNFAAAYATTPTSYRRRFTSPSTERSDRSAGGW
ncbi:GlxA family transcriptional regulator [Cryptosporangium phraense]|uniref:Helix-turn-helix domain-containing protein n=1 Tax=Cryptosporangium phraense TaxID=2593070 RepID=A0A545AEL1_9ACTN|nr:helix-turn-helix domain-containing protein [Cryptosporangium phraense]TQS39764.1 helix-turn-helix domain-containing protein [Cryptosporangium phraense]